MIYLESKDGQLWQSEITLELLQAVEAYWIAIEKRNMFINSKKDINKPKKRQNVINELSKTIEAKNNSLLKIARKYDFTKLRHQQAE